MSHIGKAVDTEDCDLLRVHLEQGMHINVETTWCGGLGATRRALLGFRPKVLKLFQQYGDIRPYISIRDFRSALHESTYHNSYLHH